MAKESLTPAQAKEMLLRVADKIIASEPLLSEADRNLGDGDHGLGMQRGMTAAKEKLSATDPSVGIDKLFSATGMAMMSSMGGASGVVFGTLFMSGAKALAGAAQLDSAGYAAFLTAACDGVTARGKAKPGDKTMVDALHPAAESARRAAAAGPLPQTAAAAAAAAESGRDASAAMIATLGRAKSLGEGSIGHPDAGACSVAIILREMSDYIAE
jgi:dihydroxyacetone kinase-like protein